METMEKPRLKYSPEHFAARNDFGYPKFTVAWVAERVLRDVDNNPALPQITGSKRNIIRSFQRTAIGKVDARTASKDGPGGMSRQVVISWIEEYRKNGLRGEPVCAATAAQHVGYLAGIFDHANSTWDDCAEITRLPIDAAMKYLHKRTVVGKSTPRTQRPKEEQVAAIKAYALRLVNGSFPGQDTEIPQRMSDFIDAARISARRMGELCRIKAADVDYESATYWVRDVKHPTKKIGNHKQFWLMPELAEIFKRQPKSEDGRIFPLRAKSVSAWYTRAKHPGQATEEGIDNLHFHDFRAEAISYWLLQPGWTKDMVRKLISGHNSDKQIDSTYDRRGIGELMANIPQQFMQQQPMAMAA